MPVELVMPRQSNSGESPKRSDKTVKSLRVSEEVHEAVNLLVDFRELESVNDLLLEFLSDVRISAELAVAKKLKEDNERAKQQAQKKLDK